MLFFTIVFLTGIHFTEQSSFEEDLGAVLSQQNYPNGESIVKKRPDEIDVRRANEGTTYDRNIASPISPVAQFRPSPLSDDEYYDLERQESQLPSSSAGKVTDGDLALLTAASKDQTPAETAGSSSSVKTSQLTSPETSQSSSLSNTEIINKENQCSKPIAEHNGLLLAGENSKSLEENPDKSLTSPVIVDSFAEKARGYLKEWKKILTPSIEKDEDDVQRKINPYLYQNKPDETEIRHEKHDQKIDLPFIMHEKSLHRDSEPQFNTKTVLKNKARSLPDNIVDAPESTPKSVKNEITIPGFTKMGMEETTTTSNHHLSKPVKLKQMKRLKAKDKEKRTKKTKNKTGEDTIIHNVEINDFQEKQRKYPYFTKHMEANAEEILSDRIDETIQEYKERKRTKNRSSQFDIDRTVSDTMNDTQEESKEAQLDMVFSALLIVISCVSVFGLLALTFHSYELLNGKARSNF
ncbi:hypothetical protein ROZALSC1DRAFT_27863 [Rozella allomycis CSF55]|uniref:Uncharacterized protein n=1 Tax=Rozella allomycis (strain CSF55) TaxID=988480 RepID=A0A4P9YPQ9_ROZAC|nr:hypothetical protein ROZALSC1DRAFT_27863 [Rozella allomycis CSF55]